VFSLSLTTLPQIILSAPPTRPGTSYDVACLTNNWQGGTPGGCGWDKAACTLQPKNISKTLRYRHRRHSGSAPDADDYDYHADEIIATCSFYSDGAQTSTKTGLLSQDGCSIAMDLPWNRFCGPLSGLWQGTLSCRVYYHAVYFIMSCRVYYHAVYFIMSCRVL
jgi:hypothetical protein